MGIWNAYALINMVSTSQGRRAILRMVAPGALLAVCPAFHGWLCEDSPSSLERSDHLALALRELGLDSSVTVVARKVGHVLGQFELAIRTRRERARLTAYFRAHPGASVKSAVSALVAEDYVRANTSSIRGLILSNFEIGLLGVVASRAPAPPGRSGAL